MSEQLLTALRDRYRVEREIGRGGMATVYLAEDLKHHRKVAIKVLRQDLSLGPERFLKEIELTAGLQHPHIVPLFDSGSAEGTLYFVMPYLEGESLRARLEREQPLPLDDALRIATEVADALDYAHRHGVVPRDIKPENVLLHDGGALLLAAMTWLRSSGRAPRATVHVPRQVRVDGLPPPRRAPPKLGLVAANAGPTPGQTSRWKARCGYCGSKSLAYPASQSRHPGSGT